MAEQVTVEYVILEDLTSKETRTVTAHYSAESRDDIDAAIRMGINVLAPNARRQLYTGSGWQTRQDGSEVNTFIIARIKEHADAAPA